MKIDLKDKDLSDLCIWLAEGLHEVEGVNVNWRVLKKFCDDFIEDNGNIITRGEVRGEVRGE